VPVSTVVDEPCHRAPRSGWRREPYHRGLALGHFHPAVLRLPRARKAFAAGEHAVFEDHQLPIVLVDERIQTIDEFGPD